MAKFCYWTVADGSHAKMAETLVKSARVAGVTEDFHVWTDLEKIEGATVHSCGQFDKRGCWFKLDFLLHEVSKLDYDYFVWLDADHYFVRKPRDIMENVDNGLLLIPNENELTSELNKRNDWWGVPLTNTVEIFRDFGCKGEKLYNTNGGLFVVRKDFIKTFHFMCYEFYEMIKKRGWTVPEEYCLAIMGNLLNKNQWKSTSTALMDIWACEWVGVFKEDVPIGNNWDWENYLTGEKKSVNPAIVHCMRGKNGLINKKWN